MNARQRRTAYRAIKAMIGRNIEFTLANGVVRAGVVLGLTKPVLEMGSNSDKSNFAGSRPSVHRVRVRLESKATMSPLLTRVKFVPHASALAKSISRMVESVKAASVAMRKIHKSMLPKQQFA